MSKYFTLSEANALLPLIRKDIQLLQGTKRKFDAKYVELKKMKAGRPEKRADKSDPFFSIEVELEFLQIEARTQIHSIHMKGALLKDIDTGVVDFPAKLDGKEVLLCWRMDEERIAHYHGLNDGFSNRKKIHE